MVTNIGPISSLAAGIAINNLLEPCYTAGYVYPGQLHPLHLHLSHHFPSWLIAGGVRFLMVHYITRFCKLEVMEGVTRTE